MGGLGVVWVGCMALYVGFRIDFVTFAVMWVFSPSFSILVILSFAVGRVGCLFLSLGSSCGLRVNGCWFNVLS